MDLRASGVSAASLYVVGARCGSNLSSQRAEGVLLCSYRTLYASSGLRSVGEVTLYGMCYTPARPSIVHERRVTPLRVGLLTTSGANAGRDGLLCFVLMAAILSGEAHWSVTTRVERAPSSELASCAPCGRLILYTHVRSDLAS